VTPTVIAIDPNYEDLSIAAFTYRQINVYKFFQTPQLNFPPPLTNAQADAAPVSAAALQDGVVYISAVGHGTNDVFSGYFNHPVFSVADLNPDVVRGKIVHLLSCSTATALGPDMVALGCRAFFGYLVPFTFDPANSDLFFQCDAQIDIGLASGLNASQVGANVKAFFQQAIDDNPSAAAYLQMNLENFRSPADGDRWGDANASLFNS
jgi:hypothetical protein